MWLDREHFLGHLVASVGERWYSERCLGVCVASLGSIMSELRDPALMKY